MCKPTFFDRWLAFCGEATAELFPVMLPACFQQNAEIAESPKLRRFIGPA